MVKDFLWKDVNSSHDQEKQYFDASKSAVARPHYFTARGLHCLNMEQRSSVFRLCKELADLRKQSHKGTKFSEAHI